MRCDRRGTLTVDDTAKKVVWIGLGFGVGQALVVTWRCGWCRRGCVADSYNSRRCTSWNHFFKDAVLRKRICVYHRLRSSLEICWVNLLLVVLAWPPLRSSVVLPQLEHRSWGGDSNWQVGFGILQVSQTALVWSLVRNMQSDSISLPECDPTCRQLCLMLHAGWLTLGL